MHRFIRLTPIFLLVCFLVACQSEPTGPRTSSAPPAESVVRDVPPTITPLPESTLLPVPEATKPVLDPESVPTLQPTSVPPGVHVQELSGMILTYPAGWSVLEETGRDITLEDLALNLIVTAESRFASDDDTYELVVEELVGLDFFAEEVGAEQLEILSEGEIPFAGDGTAQTALIGAEGDSGSFAIWLAYAKRDTRVFQFLVFGEPDTIAARQRTLDEMVKQVSFGASNLFGFNRSESLVLLGFTPFPDSFDPALTTGSAAGYVGYVNRGLVRLTSSLAIVPDLAERWEISSDGTQYTFVLRDTAFSNGDAITAQDVADSWERATSADLESTTARTYLGDILGVKEKMDGEAESIAGIEVMDEKTLIVTLDGPKPYFLAKLTYPTSFVVDVDSLDLDDEEAIYEAPTSGPYQLEEIRDGEALIFTLNPGYHSPPAVKQVVYLTDRAGSNRSLFEAGEIDMAGILNTDANEIAATDEADTVYSVTNLCTQFVQVNNNLPPFDDVDVRRAFALAVDKNNYNEIISEGSQVVASTILPPPMPGYSIDTAGRLADELGYDPEAAVAALEASSYAGETLPDIRILASGFGDSDRDDLNALVAGWQEILGVNVLIEFVDPFNFNEVARENPGHMASYGWCADYPDPENFLDILYYSDSDFNIASFDNPEIDERLEAARETADPAERLALYQAIEADMLEQVAAIPLTHSVSYRLVKREIEGFVESPMGTQFIDEITLTVAEENGEEEGE